MHPELGSTSAIGERHQREEHGRSIGLWNGAGGAFTTA